MIFFGSKGKTVTGGIVEGIMCPSCSHYQFATFGIIKYFHLYWIPTFPTSKVVGIECTHCKKTLIDKEIPSEISKQIKSSVFTKANTLPMFAGLFIIACLILFGLYFAEQNNRKEATYLQNPAINDIYIVNFNKIFTEIDPVYKYGAIRVKNVSSDELEFQVSKIAYSRTSGVNKDIRDWKTSTDDYYDDEPLYIDIMQLKGMKDSGVIYSIERK